MESLKGLRLKDCKGLIGSIALLATMQLQDLYIGACGRLSDGYLQSFVGSNISQTLESFSLSALYNTTLVDDVEVATVLASCCNLKKLHVCFGVHDGSAFGRNGLDGLQAMATGCPLLSDVSLKMTLPALHYLGIHFTNLKKCGVSRKSVVGAPAPDEFLSIEELQTLYPAVQWS
jgi:hypothetical protein